MKTSLITYLYIISVSLLSILVFPVILEPLDNDVFYHLLVAREMIDSKTPFFLHEPWFNAPEGLPHTYPPLFHWVLMVFSLGGILDMEQIAVLFQIIFYPLALLSFYHLVSYVEDKDTAFVAVVVLSTFFPFFGRTHLAIPEALQHVLIPLAFLTYLKGREKLCGLIMALMLVNHIYDSLLIFFAIVIHWRMYRKDSFNINVFLFIISLPLLIQLYGIYGHLEIAAEQGSSNHFNSRYFHRIPLAIASSLIMLALGAWSLRRKLIVDRNNITVYWLLLTMPLFFGLPNRFPAYVGPPLAVMASILVIKLRSEEKYFYIQYLPIISILLITNTSLSYIAFPHTYDFHKPGIDADERQALNWMRNNIPKGEIIQLKEGRSRYDGYRIAYYAGHETTEKENLSDYLYSLYPESLESNWTLIEGYNIYRIYSRNPPA